jgi:CBS domain-containing protein
VGLLTDRDIVVRAVAAGLSPSEAMVGEAMSVNVHRCFIDQPVDEVLEMMDDLQIRRLPVCDRDTGNLIGIVSLGDMATKHSAGIDHTLENISYPSEPDRP